MKAYQSFNAVAKTVTYIIAGVHKGQDNRPVVAKFKFWGGTTNDVDLMAHL